MDKKELINKLLDEHEVLVNSWLTYIDIGGLDTQVDFIREQINDVRDKIISLVS